MSEVANFKVPVTEIIEIKPHPNGDFVEVAIVYGLQVVVKKGQYKKGDLVVYVPIDSLLPLKLEAFLFPEGSAIKLHHNRVRQIRIRKLASQGMLISPQDIEKVYGISKLKLEEDLASKLEITKYEPPTKSQSQKGPQQKRNKPKENSLFQKYNGLTNIKWCPFLFKEGELVVYQEKIHGSNSRAGILPYTAYTIIEKIKKFFGFAPKFEFCYGSNNVQLQRRKNYTGYYGEDVYGRVFKELDAESKLRPNEIIYGEVYGEGIQKNYNYGLKEEQKFILFDVKRLHEDGTQYWLNPGEVKLFAIERGFDTVPEIYVGPFLGLDHVKKMTLGKSLLSSSQKVREGLVVKAVERYSDERGNKRALKCLSEKYLDDKNNTDFH